MRKYMWPNSCLPSATALVQAVHAASRGRFTLENVENHAARESFPIHGVIDVHRAGQTIRALYVRGVDGSKPTSARRQYRKRCRRCLKQPNIPSSSASGNTSSLTQARDSSGATSHATCSLSLARWVTTPIVKPAIFTNHHYRTIIPSRSRSSVCRNNGPPLYP